MKQKRSIRIVKLRATGMTGRLIQEPESQGGKNHFLEAGHGNYILSTLPVVNETDISETTLQEKIICLRMELNKTNKCINVHTINDGEYIILEVLHKAHPPCHLFHTYINFMDTGKGYESFDSAIIGLLEYKYQGNNSQAGEMFERMLEMRELTA